VYDGSSCEINERTSKPSSSSSSDESDEGDAELLEDSLPLYRCAVGVAYTINISDMQLHSVCANPSCTSHEATAKLSRFRAKLHDVCKFNVWREDGERWLEDVNYCSFACYMLNEKGGAYSAHV
jgi:hypothetical protein